jgi:outer membrane protein OmpA-like peptidoglycan-associated protein
VKQGEQQLVDLTFPAPPDEVRSVDVVVPWFAPLEHVAIAGEGHAAASGRAVTGGSADLARALRDLNAEVTQQQVKVNLSADLLFDFDRADIKPAAEPELAKVVTVLKSYPGAQVAVEGHTDGKGTDAYNQRLSERRAHTVADWLVAHADLDRAKLHTRGWGSAHPVAPNTRPDGSDDPEGRARNRRVEIVVTRRDRP